MGDVVFSRASLTEFMTARYDFMAIYSLIASAYSCPGLYYNFLRSVAFKIGYMHTCIPLHTHTHTQIHFPFDVAEVHVVS